jgi:hypothetical protein
MRNRLSGSKFRAESSSSNCIAGPASSGTRRRPIHRYEKPGQFIVTLYAEGPEGKARRTKVWDVTLP